jgi:hypothetical protein
VFVQKRNFSRFRIFPGQLPETCKNEHGYVIVRFTLQYNRLMPAP